MKSTLCLITGFLCILLVACENTASITGEENGGSEMYKQITAQEAKMIMDSCEEYVLLDVREQDEFDAGHIPDAVLMPYTEINTKAEERFPEKDKLMLVYCRSGRRSKIAAESLVSLGYTNVMEFGGIIDWPYDVVK